MITHLEPDILECEVKWALRSITTNKASGVDGIPVELFHSKRWCCESAALNMPANLENSAMATGLEKVSFIPIPKKGNAKECSNYHILLSFHMQARLCSKSFKLGFSSAWTENLQMYNLGLEKAEEPETNIRCIIEKAREFQKKHLLLLYSLCKSLWQCRSQQTVENS